VAAFWTALYGTYADWFVPTLAAIGTASLSPITGAGHTGLPWQENIVTAGFRSVGLAIVLLRGAPPLGFRGKKPLS
jgi:hydroxylaminobenzene mutase